MKQFTLIRMMRSDNAVLGRIENEMHKQVCVTLERPWLLNARGVSCIPVGTYTCHRYHSPKRGYDVFMLLDVPGRANIEIHIGNTTADSTGCILLGTEYASIDGRAGVSRSGLAFGKFMALLDGVNEFELVIREEFYCGS